MRFVRIAAVVVAIILILVVAAQLLATPLARFYTRRQMDRLEGYQAGASRVTASLIPLRYHLEGLSVVQRPLAGKAEPLLYVRQLDVAIDWKKLLQGRLVGVASLLQPKINVTQTEPKPPPKLPDLGSKLAQMAPVRVDVVDVRDGAAYVVDATRDPSTRLWLHGVDIEVRNIATRPSLSRGAPTTVDLKGTLQHSGELSAHLAADPWERTPAFQGRVALRHLAAPDIDALLVSSTDLKPTKGSLDVFAEFTVRNRQIDGGVKTIATNLELAPGRRDLWTKVKSWFAGAALDIFGKKEAPGTKEVATIVPIKGSLSDPNAQLWPTVLGVVRNAFVQGIDEGFGNVPPPTSEEPQGPLEQAANALKKKQGVPKAQPQARTPKR